MTDNHIDNESKAKESETQGENNLLEMEVHIPMLDLYADAQTVINNSKKSAPSSYGGYGYGSVFYGYDDDYDDESYYEDLRNYWYSVGFDMPDDEWDEYRDKCKTLKNGTTNKHSNPITSQKFINGIEVDDEEFHEYNKQCSSVASRSKTRRGGKKHKQKVKKYNGQSRTTRYNDDDWWEEHYRDRDAYDDYPHEDDYEEDFRESVFADEDKKIIFYRNLPDKEDVITWNNLHEFNEWIQDNGIEIDDSTATTLLYSVESHCCLNPETTSRVLIAERSYGDLAWEATNGDIDMLKDTTNNWNYHGL